MTELSRPKLAAKARLRADRLEGRLLLLYPERGLVLNRSAGEIVELCTGELTIARIVDLLAGRHPEKRRETIKTDVLALLGTLSSRGLLEDALGCE